MSSAFDEVQGLLKKLPGLGFRSAERIALHLLVERPESLVPLQLALQRAAELIRRCARCGNLAESEFCDICEDSRRDHGQICVVERIPDFVSLERSGAYKGVYHILHGKLSPINGVGPEHLNLASLVDRLNQSEPKVSELILAVSDDIEGEATCHYIQEELVGSRDLKISRIGFGLPSGGNIVYADSTTLRNALSSRRVLQ